MIPWTRIKSAYFISCTETDPVDDRNVQAIECFSFALKILSTLLANLSTSSFFCNRCKFINVGLENLFIDIKFPCRFLFRFFQVPQNSIFTNISLLDIDVGPCRFQNITSEQWWKEVLPFISLLVLLACSIQTLCLYYFNFTYLQLLLIWQLTFTEH